MIPRSIWICHQSIRDFLQTKMRILISTLLLCTVSSAVEFQLPKLHYGRLLVSTTDNGAVFSKQKQCVDAQLDFVVADVFKKEVLKNITKTYCDKISQIEEFRKEIECDKCKMRKVYDYTEEKAQKIECLLPENYLISTDPFKEEMESIFWFNKISFALPSDHYPTKWFDAAGYGNSGWDMEKTFFKSSIRAHPLYCDQDGIMLEFCIPMVHEKLYGDIDQVLDIGSFNPSETEFAMTKIPRTAIVQHTNKQRVAFDESKCNKLSEFGYMCEADSISACNLTSFENCESSAVETADNFTMFREIGQFYLINTKEKEYQLTTTAGDVTIVTIRANTFLLAIGERDTVTIGENNLEAIAGTHFSNTRNFLMSDMKEKPMSKPNMNLWTTFRNFFAKSSFDN